MARYELAKKRKDKRKIVMEIFHKVQTKGGRFLKKSELGNFESVSDDVAIEKMIHDFRTVRKLVSNKGTVQVALKCKRRITPTSRLQTLLILHIRNVLGVIYPDKGCSLRVV